MLQSSLAVQLSRLTWALILSIITLRELHAVDDIRYTADLISTDLFQASTVEFSAHWLDQDHLSLTLTAASIDSEYFTSISSLRIACARAAYSANRLHCDDGLLVYTDAQGTRAGSGFSLDYERGGEWRLSLRELDLDLANFSRLPQKFHVNSGDFQLGAGRWRGDLELSGRAGSIGAIRVDGKLEGLTVAGTSSLENVDAALDLNINKSGAAWTVDAAISVTRGALYIVPGLQLFGDQPGFYIEIGAETLDLNLAAIWDTEEQSLVISRLGYSHPGLLQLDGVVEIELAESANLTALSMNSVIDDLAAAFPVYIQPLLLNTNFNNLETAGGVQLDIDYHGQNLAFLDITLKDIYLDDASGRVSLSGLNGNLSIRGDAEPALSSLRWDGISFYRLDFGPAGVTFESAGGQVDVLHWDNLEVLDGKLEISRLNLRHIGEPDFEMTLDARLTPVSMHTFTQAMQWPLMTGALSGDFQGLTYSNHNLRLNGTIDIRIFAGDVTVENLLVEDIFSEYSKLSADIEFRSLDLERLTDTFAFGSISGTLNGRITDLIMYNWKPAYFEARFVTPVDDERPHRISQKALENLNSLGGGLSGTMSRGFIRFFPEYSYGQIALSCRLNNGICELGGLNETGDGFDILTQGGLLPPWVEVKGTGRSIPWDELTGGLKQIMQGEIRIE